MMSSSEDESNSDTDSDSEDGSSSEDDRCAALIRIVRAGDDVSGAAQEYPSVHTPNTAGRTPFGWPAASQPSPIVEMARELQLIGTELVLAAQQQRQQLQPCSGGGSSTPPLDSSTNRQTGEIAASSSDDDGYDTAYSGVSDENYA
jgi:hypothetical protein